MSYNQSNRSEKIETTQYRKTDRRSSSSNQQRSSSGAYGKGGGGPAPSPSYNSSNSRSYKKTSNNAQGGQSRAHVPTASVNSPSTTLDSSATTNAAAASTPRTTAAAVVQNGSHVHPQLHGAADAPVTSAAAKPAEPPAPAAAVQRSTRPVPKAPTSQSSAMSSDPAAAPKTPVKAPGDASKPYPFQFGSISPGFMNGMQVPARTSSAPPNLDEQKRDQARHDSFRPPPPLPIPTAPKQQFPRKDAVAAEQSNTGEAHSVPKVKKDVQVSPAPPASQPQKPPVLPPKGGMSMPMQYHQPQVSVQFAGPNQQLQSQGMAATPLQMPLGLSLFFWIIPMGLLMETTPQVQPPMFLQPHPMQQGIIHQSQYTAQMGPQLPPQLGNMGMGMTPPYSQQQGGKFGSPRKTTVKITHPDTHEELRLDKRADSYSDGGSSAPRSLPNMPPQSQPIPSFGPSHPLNFYNPNSFNAGSMFYPPQSSFPLTSSQLAPNSQALRFNYPVGQNPQNMAYMNPSALNSLPVNKTGAPMHVTADLPNLKHSHDVHNIISSAPPTVIPITVKPNPGSIGEKVADSFQPKSLHGVEKSEPTKRVRPSGEVSSSHPQREVTESLASKSLPVATKQSVVVSAAVSSEGLVSNPSSSTSVSLSEESVPVVPINEGKRRETLGRSNSIKDYQKKICKKGLIQSQHQVVSDEVLTIETAQKQLDEPVSHHAEIDGTTDNLEILNSTDLGSSDVGSSHGEKTSTVDASSNRSDSIGSNEIGTMSGTSDQQSAPIPAPDLKEAASKHEGEDAEIIGGGLAPLLVSGAKDKPILHQNKAKVTSKATKKKRKEICLKADAAGTTSDLYNAYKGPEEKKETILSTDYTESIPTCVNEKQAPADAVEVDAVASEKGGLNKAEPDDWEDAADLSTPKLEVSDDGQLIHGGLDHYDHDGDGSMAKKYSRDFLLKFSKQCYDLPEDFEIRFDIEAFMSANLNLSHLVECDSYPSPGRIVDRPSGGSQILLHGSSSSMGSRGGMPRNSLDADRWLRNANIQPKGLFPSPHTPLQMMHKGEKKYEVGKVTDEEQAKQRQLKAILNKLTPLSFDELFKQVKAVNIDNPDTLTGVISQIFDKALMEPTFCVMNANLCSHLSLELPDFSKDNEKITFKSVLLNKGQEEFERGEREQEEANKADEEGEIKQSAEERKEKRIGAGRRIACSQKLLGQYDKCKLTSTIGEMIDHSKAKENMDAYFERKKAFSNNMNLSSLARAQRLAQLGNMNLFAMAMAQRLAQLGEEIERIENQLRERRRQLLGIWQSLPKDQIIGEAELTLQMLRDAQHSLILSLALWFRYI